MKRLLPLVTLAALAFPASSDARTVACGKYPPNRPELSNIRAANMPCWAAKLLLYDAMRERIAVKRTVTVVGFRCRYRPLEPGQAAGLVSCARGRQSARAKYVVY